MCVFVCFCVWASFEIKGLCIQFWTKTGSLLCLYIPVLLSVPEMEGIYATGGHPFLRLYLWWSLCTLYLRTNQVRVTVGNSGLCCCVCVMSFDHKSILTMNAGKQWRYLHTRGVATNTANATIGGVFGCLLWHATPQVHHWKDLFTTLEWTALLASCTHTKKHV